MVRTRYTTEIRGDGVTRTWTLEHRLRHPNPVVTLRDATGKNVTRVARYAWPSDAEVVISFAVPPSAGRIYHVEVVV